MWAAIGTFLMDYIWKKLAALATAFFQMFQKRAAIDKDAEERVKKLKEAKTGDEIDEGIDDGLSKL